MFSGWQIFCQMTGEVAATLTGLLFIVASLISGRQSDKMARGVKLFTTPTVFHLVSVIIISGLALAPDSEGAWPGFIIVAWALFGFCYSAYLSAHIHAIEDPTHWSDFWCYGATPPLAYIAIASATLAAWGGLRHATFLAVLSLLALLVMTIRNAWDLVTWLAPRRDTLGQDGS